MTLQLSTTIADENRIWPLDAPALNIGRSSRNGIQIPDETISKEHAEVTRQSDRWYIRDLGSRNGTRVNGVDARAPLPLAPGDRIEIGRVTLTVTDGDAPVSVSYNEETRLGSSVRMLASDVLERQLWTMKGSASQVIHLLAEAGRQLVLPRPLRETCEEILKFAERAVPASRHVLLLRAEEGGEPVQIAGRARGNAASQPLALSRSILRLVLDECTSVLTADAATDPRFQAQQSIVAQMVHSALAVPLFDNQRVLGLIYVDSQDLRIRFGEEQLELLTLLANMAAVKITNARLLEAEQARARMAQELATASQIQRGLLPSAPPEVRGYRFDGFLESCYEVGGDLYDYLPRADGHVVFVVADVTGKGMGASLLMSSFLASARVLYDSCADPGELARRLDAIIHRSAGPNRFVTGFVGCLDPVSGTLRYVNAGHPSPYLVLDGGVRELESNAVPFGVVPGFPYESRTVDLRPGETLAIFSDGITEAENGRELYGEERLRRLLAGRGAADLPALRETILESVREFVGDEPRSDDITLLLVRRDP